MKRKNQKGLTLIELIVAFTVLLILTSMAVPLARARVRVERERELRYALREMHAAIDKYKDLCDQGAFGPMKAGHQLLAGVARATGEGREAREQRRREEVKLLRKIPRDPFTGKTSGVCAATRTIPNRPAGAGRTCSPCTARLMRRLPMANLIPSGSAPLSDGGAFAVSLLSS